LIADFARWMRIYLRIEEPPELARPSKLAAQSRRLDFKLQFQFQFKCQLKLALTATNWPPIRLARARSPKSGAFGAGGRTMAARLKFHANLCCHRWPIVRRPALLFSAEGRAKRELQVRWLRLQGCA